MKACWKICLNYSNPINTSINIINFLLCFIKLNSQIHSLSIIYHLISNIGFNQETFQRMNSRTTNSINILSIEYYFPRGSPHQSCIYIPFYSLKFARLLPISCHISESGNIRRWWRECSPNAFSRSLSPSNCIQNGAKFAIGSQWRHVSGGRWLADRKTATPLNLCREIG